MVNMKSVSVENLDSIVKQIFNMTLQDAERVMEFHQEIYEKWLSKTSAGAVEEKVGENGKKSITKIISQNDLPVENVAITSDKESETEVSEIERDCPPGKSVDESNCTEDNPNDAITEHENHDKPDTVTDPTKRNASQFFGEMCEKREDENDPQENTFANERGTVADTSTIVPRKAKVRKKINLSEIRKPETKQSPINERAKSELTFEVWKRRKTFSYRQMMRKERLKKRLQVEAERMEMERKRIAHETYLRAKTEERNYRIALMKKREQSNKQAYVEECKKQAEAKRLTNERAFKIWKRRKDTELREKRHMMMLYANNYCQQSPKPNTAKPKERMTTMNTQFGSWLDQLDWVLHQKYLRERRYRVQSFYCQPAYYGTAAMYAR